METVWPPQDVDSLFIYCKYSLGQYKNSSTVATSESARYALY